MRCSRRPLCTKPILQSELEGVILRDLDGLELWDASAVLGLGVALVGGVFLAAEGVKVVAGPGEHLVSLGLGGLESLGAALVASGVGGFSSLGVSLPVGESFTEESGSMSYGVLYDSQG
jgi:hypothetical protein